MTEGVGTSLWMAPEIMLGNADSGHVLVRDCAVRVFNARVVVLPHYYRLGTVRVNWLVHW